MEKQHIKRINTWQHFISLSLQTFFFKLFSLFFFNKLFPLTTHYYLTMILATERILEKQEYQKNFYVDNEKLFCDFCQGTALDHTKKNALDKHLKSKKHVNNVEKKRKDNERELMLRKSPKQEDIPFKKEDIPFEKTNIPFEKADTPFEKVDKPKNFFQEYCANGT
jgi:hypothetical protein